jgi:hypothetical protein
VVRDGKPKHCHLTEAEKGLYQRAKVKRFLWGGDDGDLGMLWMDYCILMRWPLVHVVSPQDTYTTITMDMKPTDGPWDHGRPYRTWPRYGKAYLTYKEERALDDIVAAILGQPANGPPKGPDPDPYPPSETFDFLEVPTPMAAEVAGAIVAYVFPLVEIRAAQIDARDATLH